MYTSRRIEKPFHENRRDEIVPSATERGIDAGQEVVRVGSDDPRKSQKCRRRSVGDQLHDHISPWQKLHRQGNHEKLDLLAFVDSCE